MEHSCWDAYIPTIFFNVMRRRNATKRHTSHIVLLVSTIARPAKKPTSTYSRRELLACSTRSGPTSETLRDPGCRQVQCRTRVIQAVQQYSLQVFMVDRPGIRIGLTKPHPDQLKLSPTTPVNNSSTTQRRRYHDHRSRVRTVQVAMPERSTPRPTFTKRPNLPRQRSA